MRLLLILFGVVFVIGHVAAIDRATTAENVTLSGITTDVESKSSELTTPTSEQTVSTITAADSPTELTTTEDSFLNISTSALSNVSAEIKSNVPKDKLLSVSSETTTSEPKLITFNKTEKITIPNDENVTVTPVPTNLLQSINQSNELTTKQQKLRTVIPALSSFNPETNPVQSELITNMSDSSSLPSTTILSNESITETTKQTTAMPEYSKTTSVQTEQISIKPEPTSKIADIRNEQTSTNGNNQTAILVEPTIKPTLQADTTNNQQVTISQLSSEDIISTTSPPVLRDTDISSENQSSESSTLQLKPPSIQVEPSSITNEFGSTPITEPVTPSFINTELAGIHSTNTPTETSISSTYTEPELSTSHPDFDTTPTETTISPIQLTSTAQEITEVELPVTTEVITPNSELTIMSQNPTTTESPLVVEDNTHKVTTYSPSTENKENHTQSKEPITTKPIVSIGNFTPSEVISGNFSDVVYDNNTTNGLTITNFTDAGGNHHISISTNIKHPSFNVADFLSHLASFFKPNTGSSVGVTDPSEGGDSGSESDDDDHSSMSKSSESSEESKEQGNGSSDESERNGANLWNLLSDVFGPSGDESNESGDSTADSDHHTSHQGESKESAESQEAAVPNIYTFWDQLLGELGQKLSK